MSTRWLSLFACASASSSYLQYCAREKNGLRVTSRHFVEYVPPPISPTVAAEFCQLTPDQLNGIIPNVPRKRCHLQKCGTMVVVYVSVCPHGAPLYLSTSSPVFYSNILHLFYTASEYCSMNNAILTTANVESGE
jgi:hypothetical protein